MNKYIISGMLLLLTLAAQAQRRPQGNTPKTKVDLIQSQSSQGIKRNGVDVIKVYRGTFKQDYSRLTSDSAYFYAQNNAFDAFGHVVINQGDTLNIYADKLNYNGNTHTAILTNNVRLVDKDATLSTNYLTYNTATRIGTYTGGGKLVNKTNTLVSKNGYYFAFSRDAYFRYNVVLTTNDAVIKTDTLRYNSGSRIAYFLGPSHIYGNKNKDTLYSENGTYNTITEQAFFGRKNRYAQGTKMLRGDSLFYDRLRGYGRAVRHVTFNDREQKITIKGDLGTYYNADERAVVTRNAYVILETEQQDSTKTDSAAQQPKEVKKGKAEKTGKTKTVAALPATIPTSKGKTPAIDTLQNKAAITDRTEKTRTRIDSVYIGADSLSTQVLTYKALLLRQENMRPNKLKDSLARLAKAQRVPQYLKSTSKYIYKPPVAGVVTDNHILQPLLFGKPKPLPVDTAKQKQSTAVVSKKPVPAKVRKPAAPDSVYLNVGHKVTLSDTSRIRILSAYHHSLLFKSDLQAKADSMFYSSSDSIIRCYVKPIIWTQGSQLSGDTVYLQMKDRKLNNMELFPNAFIVNIEDKDSTHFNQVAGKKMRGFFVNNKFSQMYVDGNAETIYFKRDSGRITEMERSLTSRIKANFKNNEVTSVVWLVKPEQRYGPISKFKEDERLLKGFIWQPKERPVSKESVIYAYSRRQNALRTAAGSPKTKAPPVNKPAATGVATTIKKAAAGNKITLPANITDKITPGAVDSLRRMLTKPAPSNAGKDTSNRSNIVPSARDTTRANP